MNVDKVIAKAIPSKGTGLYAVEKCEAGSTLMYIPINYAINRGSLIRLIKKNPSLRWPTADSIREMTEAQAITLYILICRYLMSSPRFQWENPAPGYHIDYVNNSLFAVQPSAAYMWQLAPHQLISIENTVLHDAINAKLNSLEREHEFASRELLDPLAQSLSATDSDAPPYPDIDLEAYKKARWLVLSRAFSFESAFLEHERKLSGSNDLHLVPQMPIILSRRTPNSNLQENSKA
jgi:hypothetical protein